MLGTSLFTPPIAVGVIPPFLPDTPKAQKEFYQHWAPTDRAVNVYMLSDGTFVQDYPTTENSNTSIPLPITQPAGAPYATIWQNVAGVTDPTIEVLPVFVTAIYYGGRETRVIGAIATMLADYTAFGAGYADCLVPA